jgi:hypothetical protein
LIDGDCDFCHTVTEVVERKQIAVPDEVMAPSAREAVRSARNENAFEMRRQRVVWT